MGVMVFVFFAFSLFAFDHGVSGKSIARVEDFELEQQLKQLNKPFVKSIQRKDGRIYDCVLINKQPAFDHPKLKYHVLQMRPTSFPQGLKLHDESSTLTSTYLEELEDGGCPIETVPIKRILKEDLIRTKSLSGIHPLTQDRGGSHYANTTNRIPFGDGYYGAQAIIGIYNPSVSYGQASEVMISISNGPPLNNIDVGWTVNPILYGDYRTRLFTRWTGSHNTGCYNTNCPGFVQTNNKIPLDNHLWPISTYGGDQHGLAFSIFQNNETNDWWLNIGGSTLGYWPASLFDSLSTNATSIVWGGATHSPVAAIYKAQMGSGRFPDEGYGKACFFSHIQLVNEKTSNVFTEPSFVTTSADKPLCYNVNGNAKIGDGTGYSFFFGGPGGICGY
ncbi:putative NEP-interacting protein [Thalictrum thalictroides]|uniref:Putative NEP-interacting protein n=1 Tax=Thalictrum thalictroides TaxID=46969 RepID=A0A7J6XGS0_THATH|nr:putative NEP-interacting protein [Thalictrum thalictroides]